MFNKKLKKELHQSQQRLAGAEGILQALNRSLAVIEFLPNGTILSANQNFTDTVGYAIEEIVGKSHKLFVPMDVQAAKSYQSHWTKLQQGEFFEGRFKRINKQGGVVWLQASYNPVFDAQGKVVKVVKFATDITAQVTKEQDEAGKINAIERVMAVIEFDLSGTILRANKNFCDAIGYAESDIVGKKHRLFVDQTYGDSAEYKAFWQELAQGKYKAGTFKRVKRSGQALWIEASYNPILDDQGKPIKIVKFATDVSHNESLLILQETVENSNDILSALAQGDLAKARTWRSYERETMFDGVNQSLRDSIELLAESLSETVGDVALVSQIVAQEADSVNHGVSGLRERMQEQAAAVQQTRSSMELVNQTVQKSAQTATHTAALAKQAQEKTNRGAQVMRQTIESMSAIQASSHKIADIVSLIDGIAFQTNLLALNAAVEAARAGDHGRGFAVVAGEVRALAQKSAEAAKEIKQLIETSVANVDEGTTMASQSGAVLDEVSVAINEVAGLITNLANASAEQSRGIEMVHQAVSHIDDATQQNTALVEEAGAAAEKLNEQATHLEDKMSVFKLEQPNSSLTSVKPRSLSHYKS